MTLGTTHRPTGAPRRARHLGLVAVLATIVAALASAAPSGAQDGGGSVGLGGLSDDIAIIATGWNGGRSSTVGVGPSWVLQCSTHEGGEIQVNELDPGNPYVVPNLAEGETGWGYLLCPINETTTAINPLIEFSGIMSYWPIDEQPPAEVVGYVLQTSLARLQVPATTGASAPTGEGSAPMIAQLPTWLWIDDADWQPRSATAGPVFGIEATATATPVAVAWSGGDDGPVDCGPNIGSIYDFSIRDELQHSACTTRFEHSSAVVDATLAASVTWRVTYSCTVPCGPGLLGDLVVTTVRPVEVAELQAVGTVDGATKTEGGSS